MPKMDRRTFSLGFLVMPLTGCIVPPPPAPPTLQPIIRNYGYWTDSSTYVVTGGLKP